MESYYLTTLSFPRDKQGGVLVYQCLQGLLHLIIHKEKFPILCESSPFLFAFLPSPFLLFSSRSSPPGNRLRVTESYEELYWKVLWEICNRGLSQHQWELESWDDPSENPHGSWQPPPQGDCNFGLGSSLQLTAVSWRGLSYEPSAANAFMAIPRADSGSLPQFHFPSLPLFTLPCPSFLFPWP